MTLLGLIGDPRIFVTVALLEVGVLVALMAFVRACGTARRGLTAALDTLKAGPRTLEAAFEALPGSAREGLEIWREAFFEVEGRWYRPEEARRLLDPDAVSDRTHAGLITAEVANQLSNTATGLGILGTFVGISLGLFELSSADAASLTENIPAVIRSLSSAFTTSILGVVVAMVVSLVLSSRRDALYAVAESVDARLRVLFPVMTSSKVLARLDETTRGLSDASSERAEAADQMRQDIQVIAEELTEKLTEGLGKKLEEQLGPALEKITQLVGDQTSNATENATAEMKRFADQLFSGLGDAMSQMSASINASAERIDGVLSGVAGLTSGLEATLARQEELVASQAAATERARSVSEDTSGRLERMGDLLGRFESLAQGVERIRSQLTTHAVKESQRQGSLQEAHEQMVETIAQARESYASSAAALAGVAPNIKAALEASASALQTSTAALAQAGRELDGHTGAMKSSVEQIVSALGDAEELVRQRGQTERELLSQYGEHHASMERAMAATQPVVEGIEAASREARDRLSSLDAAVDTSRALAEAQAKLARQLEVGLAKAAAEMASASDKISRNAESQQKWQASAEASVIGFAESLSEALDETSSALDEQLSKAISKLSSPVHDLAELVDSLEESASKILNHDPRRTGT